MKTIIVEPVFTQHSNGKIEFHCSDEERSKVACKMLLLLQAADLVEEKKIEQAHDLATYLD